MTHLCNAGCRKLVVMSNGYIIPCEAFKGLSTQLPELVLGHIKEPDCLATALERAKAIPWLTCFQDHVQSSVRWDAHWAACDECQRGLCDEGAELLATALQEKDRQALLMEEVRCRIRKTGYSEDP